MVNGKQKGDGVVEEIKEAEERYRDSADSGSLKQYAPLLKRQPNSEVSSTFWSERSFVRHITVPSQPPSYRIRDASEFALSLQQRRVLLQDRHCRPESR